MLDWLHQFRETLRTEPDRAPRASKEFLNAMADEIEELRLKVARGEACRCGHRQVDHIRDSVLQAIFCQRCPGVDDLHEFEAKQCGLCELRDRDCRCDLPIAQALD